MNIQDYVGLLYRWFQTNNSFQVERDLKNVILISENESEDRAGLKCAADLLAGEKFCQKSKDDKENIDYYFIYSTVNNQNVNISPKTCSQISGLLNKYLPLCDIPYRSNETEIKEIDILYLLKLIQTYETSKVMEFTENSNEDQENN